MKLLTTIHMARVMEYWRMEAQEVFESACERGLYLDARGIFSVYAAIIKTIGDTGWTPDISKLSDAGLRRGIYLAWLGRSFAVQGDIRSALYSRLKAIRLPANGAPVYMMPSREEGRLMQDDELGLNKRVNVADGLLLVELHPMVTDYPFDFEKNEYLVFPAQYGYPDLSGVSVAQRAMLSRYGLTAGGGGVTDL